MRWNNKIFTIDANMTNKTDNQENQRNIRWVDDDAKEIKNYCSQH